MTSPSTQPAPSRPGLPATVALYALARLGLVAVIAVVLALVGVPVLVSVLVALIVALPLSMVLFRGLRARLDSALAVAQERRSVEREALRSRLRGDESPAEVKDEGGQPGPERVEPPSDVADNTSGTGSDHPGPGEPDRAEH
jgi:Protein of unknown function (DUF4229)